MKRRSLFEAAPVKGAKIVQAPSRRSNPYLHEEMKGMGACCPSRPGQHTQRYPYSWRVVCDADEDVHTDSASVLRQHSSMDLPLLPFC